jgi:hypothetical protein
VCCGGTGREPRTGDAGGIAADPGGPSPDGTGSTVFAISKLYYGDTDRNGAALSNAWAQYGLDIDGLVTGQCSANVCTLAQGAALVTQLDGENGIDNSLGQNFMPIIVTTLGSEATVQGNTALQAGDATLLIALDGLGTNDDASPLSGAVYHAMPATTPAWNGTDVRDVDTASLAGGSVSSPLVTLGGYMAGRTWVGTANGGSALLDLHLAENILKGPGQTIPLSHVQIVMHVDPGNTTASGTLTGILDPTALEAWGLELAASVSTSFCSGTALQSIEQQIGQAVDILADGTNAPGVACNGISLGMGFDAVAVKLGSVGSLPTPPDPCADADAGDDASDQ